MTDLHVIAPGTEVGIGPDSRIRATVVAVEVRGPESSLCYQCAWWDGESRKLEWLMPFEVALDAAPREPAGFHLVLNGDH